MTGSGSPALLTPPYGPVDKEAREAVSALSHTERTIVQRHGGYRTRHCGETAQIHGMTIQTHPIRRSRSFVSSSVDDICC